MFNLSATVFIGRVSVFLIGLFGTGRGSTWPGEIALSLNKHFIRDLVRRNPTLKIILITGTNGKTTTTKLISYMLRAQGRQIVSNEAGANLTNGIASVLLKASDLAGQIKADGLVLEIDENALPHLLKDLTPDAIVVLNLFRDQLDRYGEINAISAKWSNAFSQLDGKTKLVLNGNDPEIFNLGRMAGDSVPVHYFGLEKEKMPNKQLGLDADQIFCPNCLHKLTFDAVAYSHVGAFHCSKCGLVPTKIFTLPATTKTELIGLFNEYNVTAAVLAVELVWNLKPDEISQLLKGFKPSFGRQEELMIDGRRVLIQLSKNPSGFNQAISIMNQLEGPKSVVVILNNRIPDGRDISWIWDVNFRPLVNHADKIYVAGDRAFDMALRLKHETGRDIVFQPTSQNYTGENITVSQDLPALIGQAIQETPSGGRVVIFPTYSAMLEARKIVAGKKW